MNIFPGIVYIRPICQTSTPCLGLRASQNVFAGLPRRQLTKWLQSPRRPYSLPTPSRQGFRIPSHQWPRLLPLECRRPFTPYISSRILTDYEDLPPEYRDADGLPFRDKDLTSSEVHKLFWGSGSIRVKDANTLLRILHGRRVAGTLEDPAFFHHTAQFTDEQKDVALEFLRKTVPLDETFNAGLRAQDELAQLQGELPQDIHEADSRQSRQDGEGVEEKAPELAVTYKPDPIYGHSVLEEIRQRNKAKHEQEVARQKKERAEREERSEVVTGPLAKPQPQPRELSPRMKKWIENATSDLQEPPKMSYSRRLLPSVAVVTLFVLGCITLSMYYLPPPASERIFPEIPPAAATVLAIIGVNIVVSALWRLAPVWAILNRYFILSHATPRPINLITSIFSHQEILHLFTNMAGLWFIGTRLHDDIGRGEFLAVYLSSGAVGFLGSLIWYVLRGSLTNCTLGASGAIYGVTAAYFWVHRFDYFKIFGMPPEPMEGIHGLAFLGLIMGLHVAAGFGKAKHRTDLASHWGGLFMGLIWGEWIRRKKEKEEQRLTVDLWTRESKTKPKNPVEGEGSGGAQSATPPAGTV